jgi:hypothetical protein
MPTPEEATLLAAIRHEVGELAGFPVLYTDREAILARYAELIAEKQMSDGRAGMKAPQ